VSLFYLIVGFLLPAAIHFYVWRRLVHGAQWSRRVHIAATVAIIVMFLSVPFTTSSRMWAPGIAKTLGWVTLPWLAFVALVALALVVVDVGRLATRLGRRVLRREPAPLSVSRRRFLAGATATVAGASVVRGMMVARGEHEVVDLEVALPHLPRALDGFSIVQLSDLHVGMTIDRDFVQHVVDRANALSPDLIALTGDLVDGPVDRLADDVAPLGQLRARHGVFAVTGNHEYYAGVDAWIEAIGKLGVRWLRNERVTIGDGDGFDLAGVDDYGAYRYPGHGMDLAKATDGRDPARPLVLLAHQPRQVHDAARFGVDLQLSGHTHGGQIWPWHYAVQLQQGGLLAGRYDIDRVCTPSGSAARPDTAGACGRTQLYVTRGCGYWGPPVRLLAPLEITRVILRTA
jgi:predicted MPP superfamily phosphohydrolase